MEFKLNKIDTELRQAVEDASKEGKVHTKRQMVVNKDKKDAYSFTKYDNKGKKDKKIVIEAVKTDKVEVEAYYAKDDREQKQITSGIFLDVRK